MSDAPERIWLEDERPYGGICHVHNEPTEGVLKYGTPYILATPEALAASPEVAALIAESRREGWNAAIEASADSLLESSIWCDSQERADASWHHGAIDARKYHAAAIRALKEETP